MITNLILNPYSTLNDLFFGFTYKSKPYVLHVASLNKNVSNDVKEIKISKLKFSKDLKEYQINQLDINKETYQLQLDLIDYISANHKKYFLFFPKAFLFNLPYNSKLIDKFKLEVTRILKRNMSYITKTVLSSEENNDSQLKWLFFSSVANLNNLFLSPKILQKSKELGIESGQLFDFNLKIPKEKQIQFIDFIIEHPDVFAKSHYTFNTSSDFFIPIEKSSTLKTGIDNSKLESEIQLNDVEIGLINDINENLKSTFSENSVFGNHLKKFININLLNFKPFIQYSTNSSKKDGLNIIDAMIQNNVDDEFQNINYHVFSDNFNGYLVSLNFLNKKNEENCKKLRNDPKVLELVKEALKTDGMYIYYLWILNCIHNGSFYISDQVSTSDKLYFKDAPYVFEETILKGPLKNTKTTYNILNIEKIFQNKIDILDEILYKFDSINFLLSKENWKKLEPLFDETYKNKLNLIYKKINQLFNILKLENSERSYSRVEELSVYLKNYIPVNYRYYLNEDFKELLVKLNRYFRVFGDKIRLSKDIIIKKVNQIDEDSYDLFYKVIQKPITNNNTLKLYPFNYFLDKESFIEKYNFFQHNVSSSPFTEDDIDDVLMNRKFLFDLLLPINNFLTESTDVPFKKLPDNIENLEVFTKLENYFSNSLTKEAKTLFVNYHTIVWWFGLYKKTFGNYSIHTDKFMLSDYEIEFEDDFDYFKKYQLKDDDSLKLDQRLFNYIVNLIRNKLNNQVTIKDKNIYIDYKNYKTIINSIELSRESELSKELDDLGIKIDIDNIKYYFQKIISINKDNSKKTIVQLTDDHILNELQNPSHKTEVDRQKIVDKKKLLLQYVDELIHSDEEELQKFKSNKDFLSILSEPIIDSLTEDEINIYLNSFKSQIQKIGNVNYMDKIDDELSKNYDLGTFKHMYTNTERQYLNDYTDSSVNYNRTLREVFSKDRYNTHLKSILYLLSSFSNQLSYSKKNMILYRSSENNEWLKEHIAGDYIIEPGFLSTSISLDATKDFIKNPNSGIFYIIYANKKTNGIYIKSISDVPEEKEFLLNCGSIFKILKIENRAALDEKNPLSGAAGVVYHLFYIGNISLSIVNNKFFKKLANDENKKLYQDLIDIYNNKGKKK